MDDAAPEQPAAAPVTPPPPLTKGAAFRAGLTATKVAIGSIATLLVIALVVGVTLIGGHATRATASNRPHLIASPTVAATPTPLDSPTASAVASPSPSPVKASPKPLSTVVEEAGSATHVDDPHPRLGVQAKPSWAQEPPLTTTLHSSRSLIDIYTYTKGVAPNTKNVLIQLNNPTLQGLQFTLAGFGEQDGFYLALLDVRPNNTFGWVKASDVTVSQTPYRIEISQTHHRLLLWKDDSVVGNFSVAVGAAATPTPDGYFFVNAILKQPIPDGDYGPWIVSSSGFSNVYTSFTSYGVEGDAAIGLHGSDEPTLIGQSVSHGCIRMFNSDITLMAATVPVGTIFEIHE